MTATETAHLWDVEHPYYCETSPWCPHQGNPRFESWVEFADTSFYGMDRADLPRDRRRLEEDAFITETRARVGEPDPSSIVITREELTAHVDDQVCTCYRCRPEWHIGVRCNCVRCAAIRAGEPEPSGAADV